MTVYSRLTLALGFVVVGALLPAAGNAQMPMPEMAARSVSPEAAGESYRAARYEALLVLDVLPLDAQVLLDGHPIGTARQLVAEGVPVTPGWHTVEIGAAGFHRYIARFVADQHSSANAFVVTLAPVR